MTDSHRMSTCRDAILDVFRRLERRTGERDFALADIVDEVLKPPALTPEKSPCT